MTANTLWGRSPSQARVGLFHDLAKRTDFASKVTFGSFLSLTQFKTQGLKQEEATLNSLKALALKSHPQLDWGSRLKKELQSVTTCNRLGGIQC